MEAEIQPLLKRFPNHSVSFLICSWLMTAKGIWSAKNSLQYPWIDNQVNSCELVSVTKCWTFTLGQMSNPSVAWERADVFRMNSDDDLKICVARILKFYYLPIPLSLYSVLIQDTQYRPFNLVHTCNCRQNWAQAPFLRSVPSTGIAAGSSPSDLYCCCLSLEM